MGNRVASGDGVEMFVDARTDSVAGLSHVVNAAGSIFDNINTVGGVTRDIGQNGMHTRGERVREHRTRQCVPTRRTPYARAAVESEGPGWLEVSEA